MCRSIIFHYHNLRPLSLCSECKEVDERDLYLFMKNDPVNLPFPILLPFFQLWSRLTIYNPIGCEIVSGNICLFLVPLLAQLSNCIFLLLQRFVENRIKVVGKLGTYIRVSWKLIIIIRVEVNRNK